MKLLNKDLYKVLHIRAFRWLFLSQAINLLGDAMSWTGLALLAYKIGGSQAASILAAALTIRVVIYVLISPIGGVLADKVDRKALMLTAHFFRMIMVAMLPFATEEWHIFLFVGCFNLFSAIYTPTFKASIPFVVKDKELFPKAISLSSATYQLLGVMGPGIAGGIMAFLSLKYIFWLDASTFLISSVCILLIPKKLKVQEGKTLSVSQVLSNIKQGTVSLFERIPLRLALFMQLVISIIGAEILVNTISHVKLSLHLKDQDYGFLMSAMAVGTVLGAILVGKIKTRKNRLNSTIIGAIVALGLLFFANEYIWFFTLLAWGFIGMSESMVNVPTDMLIADYIPIRKQGTVYGAHFAWSHLWWVVGYPLAGLSYKLFPNNYFMMGAIVALFIFVGCVIYFRRFGKFTVKDSKTDEVLA